LFSSKAADPANPLPPSRPGRLIVFRARQHTRRNAAAIKQTVVLPLTNSPKELLGDVKTRKNQNKSN